MTLKIKASNLVKHHYLVVKSDGVKFCETSFGGSVRRFRFHEIDCILLAPDHKLSFQVRQEVFTIPTKPADKKHQAVIATLVHEVKRANGMVETPAV
jgi:hypothetical protein